MTEIRIVEDIQLDDPFLIEGLPGIGLVAKIATDFMIDQLDMQPYATIYSDQLPNISVFQEDRYSIQPAVRIYASEEHNITVLRSDTPLNATEEFASTLLDWVEQHSITPVFLLGLPVETDEETLFGISTGNGEEILQQAGIEPPAFHGGVAGPTGALLSKADERGMDTLGLTIESDPVFPDPRASATLLSEGIRPLTGIDIDTRQLIDSASRIKEQKKQLAQRMEDMARDKKSQAYPNDMYL